MNIIDMNQLNQIKYNLYIDPSLVLYLTLEELGNSFHDYSYSGNDGSAVNPGDLTIAQDRISPKYKLKNIKKFGGTSGLVTVSDHASLNFAAGEEFTLMAWIKTNAATFNNGIGAIIEKNYYGVNPTGYLLGIYNGGNVLFFTGNGSSPTEVRSTTSYNDGRWHHIVGMRRGSVGILYVDGELVITNASMNNGSTSNAYSVGIGGRGRDSGVFYFNGLMDEVRIYRRVLTFEEIKIHASGIPLLSMSRRFNGVCDAIKSIKLSRKL